MKKVPFFCVFSLILAGDHSGTNGNTSCIPTLRLGVSFTKSPLEGTSFSKGRSFLCLWEGHLEIQFHKAPFNSP